MPNVEIKIEYDTDPQSPDEWCSLVKIAYLNNSRYKLGSEPVKLEQMDEIKDGITSGKYIGLPVYAYIHGDVQLSTEPFSCPWDSGQSGLVYGDTKELAEAGMCNEQALLMCKDFVETYSLYLQGEVYGYRVLVDGEEVDSCWGFYGRKDAQEAANEAASAYR